MTASALLVLALVVAVASQPTCLLEEPLTNACIESIDLAMVPQEAVMHLCTISYERQLYGKAEELCRESTSFHHQSGYRYFGSLLANYKLSHALKIDYSLFFANPFDHNA